MLRETRNVFAHHFAMYCQSANKALQLMLSANVDNGWSYAGCQLKFGVISPAYTILRDNSIYLIIQPYELVNE